MRRITLRLQFITPCLGHIRCDDYDRFERDATGAVVFMNSWWQKLFDYGAKAFGKHQAIISSVRVHPRIQGQPGRYKRYYAPGKYTVHEAFVAKQVITISVMLPNGINQKDFRTILNLAGQYRGVSPYGWQNGFGQFEVLEEAPQDEDHNDGNVQARDR
jgi:hypothetical protein